MPTPPSTENDLLDAMRAAPDESGPRLAYADWLLASGDNRGELVVLDQHELSTFGGIQEPRALWRLLTLSAEHGFPRLPDDPDAHVLPFTGGGACPVQYDLEHEGHRYYLRCRHGGFSIEVDDDDVLECDLVTANPNGGEWSDEETTVILSIVSEAISAGAPLSELTLPQQEELSAHPRYRLGLHPYYCFPDDFMTRVGKRWDEWLCASRDQARWYALWERYVGLDGDKQVTPSRP